MERHKFYMRRQVAGESAASFVGALRILAATCQYGVFDEEMIRDQLVEKTNNKKVQESLLSTPNLTLSKALGIASRIDSTTSFMEQMSVQGNSVSLIRKGKQKASSTGQRVTGVVVPTIWEIPLLVPPLSM